VTSVRDLGNDVDFIVALKKKFESNEEVGPRIVLAALIDGPGPFTGPTKLVVDSEADVTRVLDHVQPLGFEQTKITAPSGRSWCPSSPSPRTTAACG